jgi:hypothetical protein
MKYLSYADYTELGGKLFAGNELNFNRAEFAARKRVDSLTSSRLQKLFAEPETEPSEPQEEPKEEPLLETVKMLMLELIERGYMGKLDGEDYTSESQGRVSVSRETKAGKADKLIKDYLENEYLNGVPLIDRGGIKFSPVARV